MSSSSVGFPSLWATGLGRSGIGPEAGGGGRLGRWAGGKLRRRTCFPPGVGRSHVRDAGESVLCPARRSGAPSWGKIALPSPLLGVGGWTFLESQGELLPPHFRLAQNYFPSTLHWNWRLSKRGRRRYFQQKHLSRLQRGKVSAQHFLHPGGVKDPTDQFYWE